MPTRSKCALCQQRWAKFFKPPDGSPPVGPWPRCRHCTTGRNPGRPVGIPQPVVSDIDALHAFEDISEDEIEARYTAALAQIKARAKADRMRAYTEVTSPC
jgi:hypothetical protein